MYWKPGALQQSDTSPPGLKSCTLSQGHAHKGNGKKTCYPLLSQLAENRSGCQLQQFPSVRVGLGVQLSGRGQAGCVTGTQAWERKKTKNRGDYQE